MRGYPWDGFAGLPFLTLNSKAGHSSQGAQVTSSGRKAVVHRRTARGKRQQARQGQEPYLESFHRRTQSVGLPSISPCTETTNQYPHFSARMEYMPPTAHSHGFSHSEPRTQRKHIDFLSLRKQKLEATKNRIPRR